MCKKSRSSLLPVRQTKPPLLPQRRTVCLLPGDEEALRLTRWEWYAWNRNYPKGLRGTRSITLLSSVAGGTWVVLDYVDPQHKRYPTAFAPVLITDCKLRAEFSDISETYTLLKRGDEFILETFVWWGPE
jgi:hypothetical protein